jgi:hypothetical protein
MSTRTGALQCAFAMTILGASVPVSRLVLGFPDLTGQAGRYALATIVFVAVWRLTGRGWVRLSAPDWVRLAALAATGLVASTCCCSPRCDTPTRPWSGRSSAAPRWCWLSSARCCAGSVRPGGSSGRPPW